MPVVSCLSLEQHPSCKETCWGHVFSIRQGLPKGKVCFPLPQTWDTQGQGLCFHHQNGKLLEGKASVSSIRAGVLKTVLFELAEGHVSISAENGGWGGGVPGCRLWLFSQWL